ncbi:MAG: HNH endonuclease [Acidobacteria bacterium]|nr:MAG: HNH endonuclease [Acidobacteriota bacterium]
MTSRLQDERIRAAAFEWLAAQRERYGDVLPWAVLHQGFEFGGRRVPLVSRQGIFRPAVLDRIPLSIRTSPGGPYDDAFFDDDRLAYRYRGTDPKHPDNVGLKLAMLARVPLAYFYGIECGRYLAIWPVFVVGADDAGLTFTVQADDPAELARPSFTGVADAEVAGRRAYVTRTVRHRIHQRSFRERVLRAYRRRCALCRLPEGALLDAAHIIPDSSERGEPVVTNGIALCKLHHAAFDRDLVAVTPRYLVEVHPKVLEARDGPMLEHGLKRLHRQPILLPRRREAWPDPDRLAQRYERFRHAR